MDYKDLPDILLRGVLKHSGETAMIRRKLILGMMVTAWVLYVTSLFLPAADMPLNFATEESIGDGILEIGWEVLFYTCIPWFWPFIFGVPFVYFMVNCVFFFSHRIFWRRFQDRRHDSYSYLITLSALATWCAPIFVETVGPGYFAWSGSVTLAAVAFLVGSAQSFTNARSAVS